MLRITLAVVPLCACAAVLGIDDGHPRAEDQDGGGNDGAVGLEEAGAPGDSAVDSSVSTPTRLPDGAPIPTGCENVAINAATGVFVASTGSDSPACGSAQAPCATVQQGVNLAHDNTATPNVYVADGTYVESLTVKSGVNVIGGWTPSPGAWIRDCDETHTTIASPPGAGVTVTASDLPAGSPSKLSTLSIVAGHPGATVDPSLPAGESLFGVLATGANTVLSLVRVSVATGPAANGAVGEPGAAGSAPAAECTPGDGGPGTSGGGKGPGADAGTFSATGYTAVAANAGTSGSPGASGTPGGDAGCTACLVNCSGVGCTGSAAAPNCGSPGQAGCGGGGGQGGTGGGGGGSSVAILAVDARIVLQNCVLSAGPAGNGGAGGAGGDGGAGSAGAEGAPNPGSCVVSCTGLGVTSCTTMTGSGTGGTAGGNGGPGAVGGSGGDGAGGDSFAVVALGNAAVDDVDAGSTFSYGAAGVGGPDGGNGAVGRAGDQGP